MFSMLVLHDLCFISVTDAVSKFLPVHMNSCYSQHILFWLFQNHNYLVTFYKVTLRFRCSMILGYHCLYVCCYYQFATTHCYLLFLWIKKLPFLLVLHTLNTNDIVLWRLNLKWRLIFFKNSELHQCLCVPLTLMGASLAPLSLVSSPSSFRLSRLCAWGENSVFEPFSNLFDQVIPFIHPTVFLFVELLSTELLAIFSLKLLTFDDTISMNVDGIPFGKYPKH